MSKVWTDLLASSNKMELSISPVKLEDVDMLSRKVDYPAQQG